jgi:hypothetical protein
MKTLYSTVLIAVLALGLLLALNPGKAEAWHRGPAVSFSVVAPPFGLSIGVPAPYYYYPGPLYAAPPYPFYRRAYYGPYYRPYYRPYYGYGPYYRHRHWDHRGWRGDWGHRGYGRWHRR